MSNYISGSSAKIGAVKEDTFNHIYDPLTGRPATTALRMTSESLSSTYNRLDEGVLMASKTQVMQDLGSVSVSGGLNLVLNPSFIDWILEVSLGSKAHTADPTAVPPTGDQPDSGAELDEWTYTLAGVNDALPSSALELWKGTEGFWYSGMTVSSLAIDATAQDFVKADVSFNGTKETYLGESTSKVGAATELGSYKCTRAKLWPYTAGTDDLSEWIVSETGDLSWDEDNCPAGQVWDVESTSLTIDNGIETTPATYCSGLYANQPTHGQRSVTISCNVPYSHSFETFRQARYANENASNLALLLQFASKEMVTYVPSGASSSITAPAHQVYVILPNVQFTEANANASGSGLIDGSFTGIALSVGSTEPIKIITRTYTAV